MNWYLKCSSSVVVLCSESSNDTSDLTTHNGRPGQVKEEEEETKEQPAAKRKRGQSKSQTKSEDTPQQEVNSEGNVTLIPDVFCVILLTDW